MDIRTSGRVTGRHGRRKFRLATGLLVSCLVALNGCRVVEQTARLPAKTVSAVVPRTQPAQPDPGLLQAALLRYADDYFSRTRHGPE